MKLFLAMLAACAAGWWIAPHTGWSGGTGASVEASTAERLDIGGRVAAAELVVLGEVLASRVVQTPAGRVLTEYDLSVERSYLGEDLPARSVRLPGGVLPDGSGMLIAGMPRLGTGDEAVLFLSAPDDGGMRMPVGLSQGSLRVVPDPDGGRAVVGWARDTALLDAQGHVVPDGAAGIGSLAELSAEIQAAVAAKRAAASALPVSPADDSSSELPR